MRIKRFGGRIENLLAVLLHVIELSAVQRPREDAEDREHEHAGQRDQQVQDVHRRANRQRARRSELKTTTSELLAMPSPAAHGGSQPSRASGMQAAL